MVRVRKNNILEKNRQGQKGLGLSLVYPCAEAIELVGLLGGFDYVNLDGEHGLFSPESIDAMCRVADGYGLTLTARVPNIQSPTINSYLDRGVLGVLGPHVDTAEQAQALVNACRFVPDGHRSWGGGRGTFYNESGLIDQTGTDRKEYMSEANKEMLVMCQLETTTAFENLDAILEIEGIDAFAWGTNDLAQSMGYPGQPDHPVVQEAQNKIGERIHAAGRNLSSDITEAVALNSLILDGSKQFLSMNQ